MMTRLHPPPWSPRQEYCRRQCSRQIGERDHAVLAFISRDGRDMNRIIFKFHCAACLCSARLRRDTLRSFGARKNGHQDTTAFLLIITLAFIARGFNTCLAGIVLLALFRNLSSYVRELSRKSATQEGQLNKLLIQNLQGFKYLTATAQTEGLKHGIDYRPRHRPQ